MEGAGKGEKGRKGITGQGPWARGGSSGACRSGWGWGRCYKWMEATCQLMGGICHSPSCAGTVQGTGPSSLL